VRKGRTELGMEIGIVKERERKRCTEACPEQDFADHCERYKVCVGLEAICDCRFLGL